MPVKIRGDNIYRPSDATVGISQSQPATGDHSTPPPFDDPEGDILGDDALVGDEPATQDTTSGSVSNAGSDDDGVDVQVSDNDHFTWLSC